MAHLIISDLTATETLDRKAVARVKGGQMAGLAKSGSHKSLAPFLPVFWGPQYQSQNIAVNAAQVAHNFGYGTINQNLAINVAATQA